MSSGRFSYFAFIFLRGRGCVPMFSSWDGVVFARSRCFRIVSVDVFGGFSWFIKSREV